MKHKITYEDKQSIIKTIYDAEIDLCVAAEASKGCKKITINVNKVYKVYFNDDIIQVTTNLDNAIEKYNSI